MNTKEPTRKLQLLLPVSVYDELIEMAKDSNVCVSELVRCMMGLEPGVVKPGKRAKKVS